VQQRNRCAAGTFARAARTSTVINVAIRLPGSRRRRPRAVQPAVHAAERRSGGAIPVKQRAGQSGGGSSERPRSFAHRSEVAERAERESWIVTTLT
jgi:hypothetical protein